MGKAIIISDISFASANLGQVTLSGDIPVQSISINAPSTFEGVELPLGVRYYPLNTTQRGVSWSIVSGSEYATINANTGVLTVLSGASANNVTIKVASTDAIGIEATKTILVTYGASFDIDLAWIGTNKGNHVDTGFKRNEASAIESEIYALAYAEATAFGARTTVENSETCAKIDTQAGNIVHIGDGIKGLQKFYNLQLGAAKVTIPVINTTTEAQEYIVNGVAQSSVDIRSNTPGDCPYNIWLFEHNVNDSPTQLKNQVIGVKTYKATDENDDVKVNLKAVLHNGVPCFKDLVNDSYKNIVEYDQSGTIQYALLSAPDTPITYK